jgi:RNA polymerase sigma-70 factor (ECF subfamily)
MSVRDHTRDRGIRFAPRGALPAVGYAGEAQALNKLPDSDILCALHDLPDDLALAVYLADVQGYPYRDIAEIMGTPVGTVASRLHHGRGKLRDRLAAAAIQRGLASAPGY